MTVGRLIFIAMVLVGTASVSVSARPQLREDARVLSSEEIAARLTQRGYRDVAPPQRRGQIYLVEATDRDGSRRILVVTMTEALIVGDGPAPRQGARLPRAIIPTADAPQ